MPDNHQKNPEEFMTRDELLAHRSMGAGDSVWAPRPDNRRSLLGKLTTGAAFIESSGSGESGMPMSRSMLEKVQTALTTATPEETVALNDWALKED